ncbi:MAG: hypothetical protein AB7V43_18680 [Acidimicrobiia bacterium]
MTIEPSEPKHTNESRASSRADHVHATETCPVCDGQPRVLVVIEHPAMLRYTRELLERECACWVATETSSGQELVEALDRLDPDLLIVDAGAFPSCCPAALSRIALDRVIVIGPEPDIAYRDAALTNGAGGWIARDEVGERLGTEMRRVLGCRHDPCPPADDRYAKPLALPIGTVVVAARSSHP